MVFVPTWEYSEVTRLWQSFISYNYIEILIKYNIKYHVQLNKSAKEGTCQFLILLVDLLMKKINKYR